MRGIRKGWAVGIDKFMVFAQYLMDYINSKHETLNSKQTPISKLKIQNRPSFWDFGF